MAGTSAVVESVIEQGKALPSRARKLAKIGTATGKVAKSGPGGGVKNIGHWLERDLAWYGISYAVAEPITAAETLVPIFASAAFVIRTREYSALGADDEIVRVERTYDTRRPDNALLESSIKYGLGVSPFVGQGDVSQVLQIILLALANGSLSEKVLRTSDLQFFFTVAGPDAPRVSVHFDLPDGSRVMDLYYLPKQSPLTEREAGVFDRSCIRRTAQIGPDFLIILANLLRDSLQHVGGLLPPGDGSPQPGGQEKGAAPLEATPSKTSLDDETTAAKRGHTTQSRATNCEPIMGECVCPGDVFGLGAVPAPNSERTHTHDREDRLLAA